MSRDSVSTASPVPRKGEALALPKQSGRGFRYVVTAVVAGSVGVM
nr:MAG TPA: hypothetical protein [Inoviridae sp.]